MLFRSRRERGIEPLPGERLGIAGGGSRLAPAYFERQARLEDDGATLVVSADLGDLAGA